MLVTRAAWSSWQYRPARTLRVTPGLLLWMCLLTVALEVAVKPECPTSGQIKRKKGQSSDHGGWEK